MMAQDFQDLTGQVIKKVTHMVQSLEKDLIDLLLANVPAKKNIAADEGLLNGQSPTQKNELMSYAIKTKLMIYLRVLDFKCTPQLDYCILPLLEFCAMSRETLEHSLNILSKHIRKLLKLI